MVEAFCPFTDTFILVELLQELHIATADDTEEWSGNDAGGGTGGLAALEALKKLNRPPPPDAREPSKGFDSKLLASEFATRKRRHVAPVHWGCRHRFPSI